MAYSLSDVGRNAGIDGITALLDGGKLVLQDSGDVVRVTLTLPNPIPGAAAGAADLTGGGSLTGTPAANADVDRFELRQSDDTVVVDGAAGSVSDTAGAGDIQLDDGTNDGGAATVTTSDTVQIDTLTLTLPAS